MGSEIRQTQVRRLVKLLRAWAEAVKRGDGTHGTREARRAAAVVEAALRNSTDAERLAAYREA